MTKVTFRQRLGWLLPEGGDSRDITIKRLQNQLDEITQILADNRLMKLVQEVGGPSEGRSKRLKDPPRGSQNRKQRESCADLESRSDSNSVAPSKRRVSPGRARSSMDLRETINTKLPIGLIASFHQLTESFVTRFVINTKVPKGVDSLF